MSTADIQGFPNSDIPKFRNCIIDKNAKIGKNMIILNKDGVEGADRPREGFYIRAGITVILEKATIIDGMVI